jgi:hypothetical protein
MSNFDLKKLWRNNANMRKLTEIEKKTLNFVKETGEVQTTNLPNKRMWGTVPALKNMGLIEVFKKYTSQFRSRKKKFLKIKEK